jgi:hypothetical protein
MLCRYAECRVSFTIILSVVTLNVVMLSVVAPNRRPATVTHATQFSSTLTSILLPLMIYGLLRYFSRLIPIW